MHGVAVDSYYTLNKTMFLIIMAVLFAIRINLLFLRHSF